MTYSSWLTEVDDAFKKEGRRTRVRDLSPSALLAGFEAGTAPEAFAKETPDFCFADKPSPGFDPGYISGFLGDASCLESLNRSQASFVVRCLTVLGWFCFGLAVLFIVFSLSALVQSAGAPYVVPESEPIRGLLSSGGASRESMEQRMLGMGGEKAMGFLSMAFNVFIIGILSWWGSAMLRGLYVGLRGLARQAKD